MHYSPRFEVAREEFLSHYQRLHQKFLSLSPELELTIRDPDYDLEGYVVVWNTQAAKLSPLGRCGKGGTRITPQLSLEEVKMLARIMTLKNAAAGLPLGGAKSGIRAHPDEPGFERKYRRFCELVRPLLIEHGGIFGGLGFDIGGKPEHAIWACQALGSPRGFTGKPLSLGGTDYDREGIAGLGVATAADALLHEQGLSSRGRTFAVQGLGAMGGAIVRYFSEYGGLLAALSDPRIGGTYLLPQGASPQLLESISRLDFQTTRSLLSSETPLPLDSVLFQKVEILFPAAVQDVITTENERQIEAQYVIEGANNPCSEEARNLLHSRGIHLIPDFIANPGGIIAAYVEMSTPDDPSNPSAKAEKAKAFTREKIRENISTLVALSNEIGMDNVLLGRYMAYSNIFQEDQSE